VVNDVSLFESHKDPTPKILYLPPLPWTNFSGDAKTWRLIFPEDVSLQKFSKPQIIGEKRSTAPLTVPEVTFDLLEALAIDPVDNDRMPTPSVNAMGGTDQHKAQQTTNHVNKLIREADEAFQAADTALADAKAAQKWYDTTVSGPVTRNIVVPRGISKNQQNASNSPAKTPISRSKSANSSAKSMRAAYYQTKLKQLSKAAPKVVSSHHRWADVTTNMVDVLSGKMFRTEVDEMLTPSRMKQLKGEVIHEGDQKAFSETTQDIETDDKTPTQSFHFESLSARISSATPISPTISPLTPLSPSLPSQPTSTSNKEKEIITSPDIGESLVVDSGIIFIDHDLPPPPLPPRSSLRPKPESRTLPTILESSVLAVNTSDLNTMRLSPLNSPSTQYAILRSTPFTLTSPLFRHGNICIEHPAMPDEVLDWTAFHMAISGTIDDQGETCGEMEHNFDEAEIDDLVEWWKDFHLPLGEIIRRPPKSQRMVVYIKDKNNQETPWKVARAGDQRLSGEGVTWGVKMEPCPETVPWIPMNQKQEPVLGHGEESAISMGYNLNHDLGDFLKWEFGNVQNLQNNG
jgi:hypothetical protein